MLVAALADIVLIRPADHRPAALSFGALLTVALAFLLQQSAQRRANAARC